MISRASALLRHLHLPKSYKVLSAVGVLSAALIAVNANILVSRFYTRWDWTSEGLYTLSPATLETLRGLDRPLQIIVFLGSGDAMTSRVRQMLSAYRAETQKLDVRFVDPDRNTGEFLALQQKFNIVAGRTEAGRVVTDASLVVASPEKHWFIGLDDLVLFDEKQGRSRPAMEQSLTEGIRQVLDRKRTEICFTTGHREIALDDLAPSGLVELRQRLEKNNYEVKTVSLAAPITGDPLSSCDVAVVAGPSLPFSSEAATRLADFVRAGHHVLLLLNPVLDDGRRIAQSGLAPVTQLGGFEFAHDFVLEGAKEARLPGGAGESFMVEPSDHAVTEGLIRRKGGVSDHIWLTAAQSLKPLESSDVKPHPLLSTSEQAFALADVRPFLDSGALPSRDQAARTGRLVMAFAAETASGSRIVAVGSANVAWSRNWREPALYGTRLFTENAVSWLAARPKLVSVPEKASRPVGLSLTESSLGEVWRYVLIYMPGASILMGIYILVRRRRAERQSRKGAS